MASLSIYNPGFNSDNDTTNRGTKERAQATSNERSQRAYKAWETKRRKAAAIETAKQEKAARVKAVIDRAYAPVPSAKSTRRKTVKAVQFREGDQVVTKTSAIVRRAFNLLNEHSITFKVDRRSSMRFVRDIPYNNLTLVYICGKSWRSGYAFIPSDAIEIAK